MGDKTSPNAKEFDLQYSSAKCLKCGLCLEVCPNYIGSKTADDKPNFMGAVLAHEAYLLLSSNSDRKRLKKPIKNVLPMAVQSLLSAQRSVQQRSRLFHLWDT